jgi:hypothetical protein
VNRAAAAGAISRDAVATSSEIDSIPRTRIFWVGYFSELEDDWHAGGPGIPRILDQLARKRRKLKAMS